MCKLNLNITLPQANMAMENATFNDIPTKTLLLKGMSPCHVGYCLSTDG